MLKVRPAQNVESLALDLTEDLATRWMPDPLADVDLLEQLRDPSLRPDDVQFVEVPRVGGGFRCAPVLGGGALRALRDAVANVREVSESLLDPAVCGYRAGATGDSHYSDEYRRFRNIAEALADGSGYVVLADVRNFFGSVDAEAAQPIMEARLGEAWEPVNRFLHRARDLGIAGLPAGYGDARLIANLILATVDESIDSPFTRWVDDYRIFVSSNLEAERVLRRLEAALGSLGLGLNCNKVQVLEAADYRARRHGVPLDSVYHPQDEPAAAVRANLRTVFLRAVTEENRRMLRFALPRLAEQRDDLAVPYALKALAANSVDAPRLVHYLSVFVSERPVRVGIEDLILHNSLAPWTLVRLAPLLARMPLSDRAVERLSTTLRHTDSSVLWGALLRVMSVQGQSAIVLNALSDQGGVLDPRSAMAACKDLEREIPQWLAARAPKTARVVRTLDSVPLPRVGSLL